MKKLAYIGRLVKAVWLLLLLAVAPAVAQNVVFEGNTTPLSVEQKGLDSYQWHLYSDSTVNFAVAPADVSPSYAEFIGPSNGPEVTVLWKTPGTYFFKVTAVDANDCAMNLKIGRMTVKKNPIPVLTAEGTPSICPDGLGEITFTVANTKPGNYTIKHNNGAFNVTIVDEAPFTIQVPPGTYNNLTIEVDGYSSYDRLNPVNAVVAKPAPFVINESVTDINLKTNAKGAITLIVQGNTTDYTYSWSNGATTKDIDNLEIGIYNVTVTDRNGCSQVKTIKVPKPNSPPVAVNDAFRSGCNVITGNLIENDTDEENDDLFIGTTAVVNTAHGKLTLKADGTFEYRPNNPLFTGVDQFTYALFDKKEVPGIHATVMLTIFKDTDHDDIADADDPDADGDGILNEREVVAGKDWRTEDTDGDSLPNYLDIDSDGDGIVDNIEAQSSAAYRPPVSYDANRNGINDAYEGVQSRYEIYPVDTDGDGDPDFLDKDSDNDSIPDSIEGHADRFGKVNKKPQGYDLDEDGLDDVYDTVINECGNENNMLGSNATRQDTDGDGQPNWRDDNDDNDLYPTILEDLDGDGDFSNDEFDYDGIPEYLDFGRDCDLFIPNAFSPNEDGVHDLYQIYCINHYPNAKIYIFDQLGNKLFEKANYGNEERWGIYGDAWWDGKPDRGRGKGQKVAPGTYFYVLDLGNGEVKKSFVFVSY